jgi:predicted RNase H-like nuclease (RuvC/YqgF family)
MAHDDDLSEEAARHIRDLDAHLERLKQQNEALDALSEQQNAEVEQLKRMLSEAAAHFRAERGKEPPKS